MTGAEELFGMEWDFLAVDTTGAVALLSTAGYGPVPARVLAQRSLVERAVSELEVLPPIGAAKDRREPGKRSGDCSDWLRMSERGLYAYDWGIHYKSYTLLSAPAVPLELSAFGPTVREAAGLLALPVRFAAAAELVLD